MDSPCITNRAKTASERERCLYCWYYLNERHLECPDLNYLYSGQTGGGKKKGMEEKWPFTKVFAGKLCSVFIVRAGCQHTNKFCSSVGNLSLANGNNSDGFFLYSSINSGLCVGFSPGVFFRCCCCLFCFSTEENVIELLDILYFKLSSIRRLIWLKRWSTLNKKHRIFKACYKSHAHYSLELLRDTCGWSNYTKFISSFRSLSCKAKNNWCLPRASNFQQKRQTLQKWKQ